MAICLNGVWDTVLNVEGDKIPREGWSPRRTPAMPLITHPAPASAWYRYRLRVPRAWMKPDRSFLLKIDKAGHYTAVYWNSKLMGEHFGQFTPFQIDVTAALRPGDDNEIAIFVHNALGRYARPGMDVKDPMEGNAYRGATENPAVRNWVGIVGDIELVWRPKSYISDMFVVPSVRKKQLSVRVETAGVEGSGLSLRASVLDDGKVALRLPEQSAKGGPLTFEAAWPDPVLWGPAPYGQPKLYILRTELLRKGKVVDRSFTRFGFREVWVDGKDVLLNGKKLWMAGTYFGKLAPIRYINDRRPQARMLALMQESGLNTLHGHWDELGETWLDLCDEMGVLVLGGFYCDGRPQIQSKAGAGWGDFMIDTCRRWVRTVRNHPAIVVWRPADGVMPPAAPRDEVIAGYIRQVRTEDGTRPIAVENESTDIIAHSQSPLKDPRNPNGEYDDGSIVAQKLASATKPVLTKEIYAGFRDVEKMSLFFRQFYEKSWDGKASGIIVQHLPLMEHREPFRITWLSDSGPGNRDSPPPATLPNWCDPQQPVATLSAYGRLFAELFQQYLKVPPAAETRQQESEVLASGLKPDELAILRPRDEAAAMPIAVRAAADGTAWIVAPRAGEYTLAYQGGSKRINARAGVLSSKPGYDYVERVAVSEK